MFPILVNNRPWPWPGEKDQKWIRKPGVVYINRGDLDKQQQFITRYPAKDPKRFPWGIINPINFFKLSIYHLDISHFILTLNKKFQIRGKNK
jgi:hypothetical protein